MFVFQDIMLEKYRVTQQVSLKILKILKNIERKHIFWEATHCSGYGEACMVVKKSSNGGMSIR